MQLSPSIQEVLDSSERLARQRSQDNEAENNNPDDGETYINFLLDDPQTMTYGRRLALFLMKRYAWYNPALKPQPDEDDDGKAPSRRNQKPHPARRFLPLYAQQTRTTLPGQGLVLL